MRSGALYQSIAMLLKKKAALYIIVNKSPLRVSLIDTRILLRGSAVVNHPDCSSPVFA